MRIKGYWVKNPRSVDDSGPIEVDGVTDLKAQKAVLMTGASREELIVTHIPLVRKIAGSLLRIMPPSIELDDMVSDGTVGLIWAADRWDERYKVPFRLYAKKPIRGHIIDANRRRHYLNATHAALDKAQERGELPHFETDIDRARTAQRVGEVIEMLPGRERRIVKKFYAKDLTNADIGRATGVPSRKVCEIHRKALGIVRRGLEARGMTNASA